MNTPSNELFFDTPASGFLEAIPIGNGRLGALVHGELLRENLFLNESSMWSGSRTDNDREDAWAYLPKIRELLSKGENYKAQQLFSQHFTCKGIGSNFGHGSDVPFGCYQVLGRLSLSYFQAISHGREDCYNACDYRRSLCFEDGTVRVSFKAWGLTWFREYLVSEKYQLIVMHLWVQDKDKPVKGKINLSAGLDRDECFEISRRDNRTLLMQGQLDDGKGSQEGVCYACALTANTQGGTVKVKGSRIFVEDADTATILIAARTNLSGFLKRKPCDPLKEALNDLQRAASVSYEEIYKRHSKWYAQQMNRMDVSFIKDCAKEALPLPQRLQAFNAGADDPGLLSLYIRFGRHLLLSSSQKGNFPANLQGLWSEEIRTPWNGDWHLNAQQELYWLSESGNLSECHLPFIELTKELVGPGEKTAWNYYHSHGWAVHTMTNPWGVTSPLEEASWGSTAGSGAWQCRHLFDHYLYNPDQEYLAEIWPVMKGSASFYMDLLVEDATTGYLVTSPSSSPENSFLDEEGRLCALCEGPTYDRMLVWDLFENCIEAQYVLGNDPDFAQKLKELQKKLAPVEIGPDGRIMEWGKNYTEALPFHRHLSHLWGVYPGSMITPERTPALAKAALCSLLRRGTTTAGWACAYRAAVAARLRDGEAAYGYIKDALLNSTASNFMNLAYHCDETTLHHERPKIGMIPYQFQMDGNEANAEALLLLIIDDEARILPEGRMEVHVFLLPALPKALASGHLRGIRLKGGLEAELWWEEGHVLAASFSGAPQTAFFLTADQKTTRAVTDENGFYRYTGSAEHK